MASDKIPSRTLPLLYFGTAHVALGLAAAAGALLVGVIVSAAGQWAVAGPALPVIRRPAR